MYRQFFGLKHDPLGKDCTKLWDNGQIANFEKQFKWLLQSPGVGLLTADPGLGKSAMLHRVTSALNPNQYHVFYTSETDFGRLEFYRHLAVLMGLQASSRRSQLWRDLKGYISQLYTQKNILPILIIDESQHLSAEFLRDFPSFLNFVFDSKDYITVWFVGHTSLAKTIDRPSNIALASRIQVRFELKPITDSEPFKKLLLHAFECAGCTCTLLPDSAIELIRLASNGNIRIANHVIVASLRLAADRNVNHLPDEIVKEAIEILKL
jgi:type II secretory pathway predicted ATPase ExeA